MDLLLNGHPQIIGLGEVSHLPRVLNPLNPTDRNSLAFGEDYIEFWRKVRKCYESKLRESFEELDLRHPRWMTMIQSWSDEDVQKWAWRRANLLTCIHEISKASILVDDSKFHHQLYLLHKSGLFNINVIHLIRDGRAVVNSYIRRHLSSVSVSRYKRFKAGMHLWMLTSILSPWLRKKIGEENWLQIRYEDLATRPEDTLKRICRFVNLDFEPTMLRYRSQPYFGVAGNPLVRDRNEETISLDERWRHELPSKYRLCFAVIGGWLNWIYGYGIY